MATVLLKPAINLSLVKDCRQPTIMRLETRRIFPPDFPPRRPIRPHPKPTPDILVSKEPPVTIVAGFNCSDALLLAADTEVTTPGISKLQSSKIFRKEYRNGIKSAIGIAGSLAYGRMEMQHIEQILEAMGRAPSTIKRMRKGIEEEVCQLKRRHADVDIQMLVALWSPKDCAAALLWVEGSAVNELFGYSAIGAGGYLADYLLRPKYKPTMLEQNIRPLAIEAITAAKNFVPGCGGFTELIKLTRNGILGQVERLPI